MHENKAGFEALSSQKKVSLLLRQIRTIQRWLKLVQEVFLFFRSESFSIEEGFSHTASGHICICIRRKKCEASECAFCWLIVYLQTSSHPLPWHSGHASDCLLLPKWVHSSWPWALILELSSFHPKLCVMSTYPHAYSFEALVTRLGRVVLGVKNLLASAEDVASIPGSGRSAGGGNGSPLQYSCLDNPMDREAWCPWGGGCKSWTWLSD